ncbi:MAG TPA: CopG family transcriptional regulator [Actinomycetota bacterium]|nr:CopG family transcriptional regulator [Actinomycetota bacterium]
MFDSAPPPGEDDPRGERRAPLLQTLRIPEEVAEQLRMLTTVTGVPEQEHLRRAMRGYLETAGRHAEVTALTGRARERLRAVLDELGDL